MVANGESGVSWPYNEPPKKIPDVERVRTIIKRLRVLGCPVEELEEWLRKREAENAKGSGPQPTGP